MTVKMIAYVAVSPIATALVARLPRKPVLVVADLLRAGVALSLPFVTEAWQIYALIFLLQSASATFTPTFQAVIPSVLPEEKDYTRALSLSRLAYDLEALVSPMLAAAVLTVLGYHDLFVGTVLGFLCSAALVLVTSLPRVQAAEQAPFHERVTHGVRLFWTTPELRGLMGMNLVEATATAMVIVNTVVLVQGELGRPQSDVAVLLGANGLGSMLVALGMPTLLDRLPDRRVMLTGTAALPVLLLAAAGVIAWTAGSTQWVALLLLWMLIGAAGSTILTPSSRLLRRNSNERTAPALFAAQFSLSHACFLLTYPIAGGLGAAVDLPAVALVLVGVGLFGLGMTVSVGRRSGAARPPRGRLSG
ncbi:MAG: MFS transporter [Micrococcus sp.]|nr:MFS transporter [Micrococcus sp.]MDY6054709.1 MFS transporter [Micrococcus sp.]